jgi:DNA polymerase I-like protein with 3'-5' exonuclease and polymerase domains
MTRQTPDSILIDRRNIVAMLPMLMQEFGVKDQLNGFDLETEDSNRHEGLNRAMKVGEDGHKGAATKLLFDPKRTKITGFSLYAQGAGQAYYFNMWHADADNRIPFPVVRPLLDLIKKMGYFIAHKAPFELCMTKSDWDFDMGHKVICTLQLAVTCFNDDTYPLDKFLQPGLGEGFKRLVPGILRHFAYYQPGDELTADQEDLIYKFIAKESDAEHSYNGFVKGIKYGYGLKALTAHFLGYQQKTFAETLGDKAHMGELTGEEVTFYGADDAWTCVWLYEKLMKFLIETNPKAVSTFFEQENPMIHHYADVWRVGVRTDERQVYVQQGKQRAKVAKLLREMKKSVKSLLPFDEEPHEKMSKYDKAWAKSGNKYRMEIMRWCHMFEETDDYRELMQTRTALSKQWAEENGHAESKGLSLNYYQVVRGILYDLCGCSFQLSEGKVQSDSEAQRIMAERWAKKHEIPMDEKTYWPKEEPAGKEREVTVLKILSYYKQLAESNQVIKLYINKYLNLIDPDTSRVHPILSSQLNSHRMALEEPNLSQLPKNSGTAWVRSFILADEKDHVIVSADWSAVELVLIGEESGDPVFAKAYSQLPHDDLHSETGAALYDQSLEEFKAREDKKIVRNKVAKPANFGYWYSGALGTTAKEMNWTSDQMWEFVEKYRNKFAVGEAWRVGVIQQTRIDGYTDLADGHRRYRYESTGQWAAHMQDKFAQYGDPVSRFGAICIKKIQNRSGNQSVNSRIQGSCATLAKRSILNMQAEIVEKSLPARFMFPVHDELVYSVHRKHAVEFAESLSFHMRNHPGIVKNLKLDVAVAIGRNYLAWDAKDNPQGQVELDEASKIPCLPENRWGQKLTKEERQLVVDYLFQ